MSETTQESTLTQSVPPTGRFIVFEGGEGSGKSTQAAALADRLRGAGRAVTYTREPGGTPPGQHIREMLLDRRYENLPAKAETLLFLADRAIHAEMLIRPALDRGDIVICDRYADSTSAYQGAGRELGYHHLADLSRWTTGNLDPDLVLLLDVDPRVGLARAARRSGTDRIEQEAIDFHDRVRSAFLDMARTREGNRRYVPGTRYVVFDATRSAADVASGIAAAVNDAMTDWYGAPCKDVCHPGHGACCGGTMQWLTTEAVQA